ncbi:3422_t:CDS:2, partial [Funneliformis geosporum]
SEPTPEEVNNAKSKLKQARESNNKDEIVNILNETEAITQKSSDQSLKQAKAETENKLGQLDKEELRKIIKEEVTKELQKFKVKTDDLSPQRIKALEKLISELKRALEKKDKKEIGTKVKNLRNFIDDRSDEYAQNAYQLQKEEAQKWLEKAEKDQTQSSQNQENGGFFRPNNPLIQKQVVVKSIQSDFQQSKAVIFYNFHQVENQDLFKLRKELKKLRQANAFIFCQDDEYQPLSILNQFNKEHSSIKRFQGGIYEQKKKLNQPPQEINKLNMSTESEKSISESEIKFSKEFNIQETAVVQATATAQEGEKAEEKSSNVSVKLVEMKDAGLSPIKVYGLIKEAVKELKDEDINIIQAKKITEKEDKIILENIPRDKAEEFQKKVEKGAK